MDTVYIVPYDEQNYNDTILAFKNQEDAKHFSAFVEGLHGYCAGVVSCPLMQAFTVVGRTDKRMLEKNITWLWSEDPASMFPRLVEEDNRTFVEVAVSGFDAIDPTDENAVDELENKAWKQCCDYLITGKEQEA